MPKTAKTAAARPLKSSEVHVDALNMIRRVVELERHRPKRRPIAPKRGNRYITGS